METKKEEVIVKNNIDKIKKGKNTRFLDPKEAYIIESHLRKNKLSYQIYKPFETANSIIFYTNNKPQVSMLRIKNNNFKHSDIMGSYFSLGIDKSIIGDIVVKNDFVYLIVLTEYENFLIDNFVFIKNEYVCFEKIEWIQLNYDFEELIITVSSNRLDAIISKLLKLSRNSSNELFLKKDVYLNYNIASNNVKVKENDVFSVRRYGKYVVETIETYKNKLKIILKKYI